VVPEAQAGGFVLRYLIAGEQDPDLDSLEMPLETRG
jgi:hypothetical protein